MTLRGAARQLQVEIRQRERKERARQRELVTRAKYGNAAYKVAVHENQLEILNSIHKECRLSLNWQSVARAPQPVAPQPRYIHSSQAQADRVSYKPGFFEKLLGEAGKQIARLDAAVEDAAMLDQRAHHGAMEQYKRDLQQWQSDVELARGVLTGRIAAYERAIKLVDPFEELRNFGSYVRIESSKTRADSIAADIGVAEHDIVPSEIKSLTRTGKLSERAMPKGRSFEIYQDYVCGACLRVARELLALLPIDYVLVTANTQMLNTATGHDEDTPILSVIVPRQIADRLNFDRLDPSDSMANFPHRISFKKTKGFAPVERYDWEDIPAGMSESA